MVINIYSLPQKIIDKYGLLELAHGGCVYIEIQKGMYDLPQAGILANKLLQRRLDGYRPTEHTHRLWKHKTRINYIGRDNAEHLMASIKKQYAISSDWTGSA
jgi:hypothetical protein